MPYHIINIDTYSHMPAPCGEPSCERPLPHNHTQDYAPTLCQQIVLRYKDDYCSVHIAKPAEWDYDWCQPCVQAAPWQPEYAEKLVAKGLLPPPGNTAGPNQGT